MIGVFDSGVGGLSVWREIAKRIPDAPLVYLADQAHVPYGSRTLEEARSLTVRCVGWLIERGCTVVVVACNTASGAALERLRETFPDTAIIGMEPAIKPASLRTKTGVIGVLATPATFKSQRYSDLLMRFGSGLTVIEQTCAGWVEAVETLGIRDWGLDQSVSNSPHRDVPQSLVSCCVTPLLDQNADTLVFGCTHFPFLMPQIERAIDEWRARLPHAQAVTLIDPAPAVAQQTLRVWGERMNQSNRCSEFWTTGAQEPFTRVASALLGQEICARMIRL